MKVAHARFLFLTYEPGGVLSSFPWKEREMFLTPSETALVFP